MRTSTHKRTALVNAMPSQPAPELDTLQTIAPANDLLLRAARGERTERTPVLLMRQAGRFDPKYLAIRDQCGLKLEQLFRDPQLASEITMLPIRLGVDAAILFQDILTPLAPLGANFVFRPGPILENPIRDGRRIEQMRVFDPRADLPFVSESIKLVLHELDGSLPLIGFAGAPLTLATFMIEGRSPGDNAETTQRLMQQEPTLFHRLLDLLTQVTTDGSQHNNRADGLRPGGCNRQLSGGRHESPGPSWKQCTERTLPGHEHFARTRTA